MDSSLQVNVPLRLGGKKIRKRRELDALISHSLTKRTLSKRSILPGSLQDKLLSVSTDDQEDFIWHKVNRTTHRVRKKKYFFFSLFAPALFVISFSLLTGFMYWLYFDLRQQIYEYRQRMEEVSVMNQDLPDTLQKWHETSTLLFKNQTVILSKINQLQVIFESLQSNFSAYKVFVGLKDNHGKDEKIVADFGAKIESIFTDIDSIKDHNNAIINSQKIMKSDLNELQVNLSHYHLLTELSSAPQNCSKEIYSLKSDVLRDMAALYANLSYINITHTQKTAILNDEILTHKAKIDELFDRSENITSHVASIKNSWIKYQKKIDEYEKLTLHLNNNLTALQNKSYSFEYEIKNMCGCCINSSIDLAKKGDDLKKLK